MLNLISRKNRNLLRPIIFGANCDSEKILNLFARSSEILGASLDYSETTSHICEVPIPLLADWSCLFVINEKRSEPTFAYCHHKEPSKNQPLTAYFKTNTINFGQTPTVLNTLRSGCSVIEVCEEPLPVAGHLLTLPLIRNAEVLGFLTLGAKTKYTAEDILLAEEVSGRAAMALYNAQRFQQVCIAEAQLLCMKNLAEKVSQANIEFLANFSHEIRTPVSVMLGYSELLATESSTYEKRFVWSQKVKQSGTQLLRQVDDLLNLAKSEQGQVSIKNEIVIFNSFYKELFNTLLPRIYSKTVKLEFLLATPMPAQLTTDPIRLQQILINVIGNAIKFTDTGSVTVRAGYLKNTGLLYFDIEDTGPGLTNKESAKLFQPFSQADTAHSKRHGGSGLGLALSLNLARLLGGDLELVSSEPGVGSVFRVFIKPSLNEHTEFISVLDF